MPLPFQELDRPGEEAQRPPHGQDRRQGGSGGVLKRHGLGDQFPVMASVVSASRTMRAAVDWAVAVSNTPSRSSRAPLAARWRPARRRRGSGSRV